MVLDGWRPPQSVLGVLLTGGFDVSHLIPTYSSVIRLAIRGLWIGVSVFVGMWLLYVILAHVIMITKFGKLDNYTDSNVGLEAATLRTFRWLRWMRWSCCSLRTTGHGHELP